jgi:prepilin-type N-terminal cleavage/methylation domain-containing protein
MLSLSLSLSLNELRHRVQLGDNVVPGSRKFRYKTSAFTIVELLVVIVVIGILVAITIVSYSGIANKAVIASLQSDLDNNSKQLKLYNVEYGYEDADDDYYNQEFDNGEGRGLISKFARTWDDIIA